MKVPFYPADILLPQGIDMQKWSVVACDQHTSEPRYWKKVEETVGNAPSSYNIIYPEIYLDSFNKEKIIEEINQNMRRYMNSDFIKKYKNALIYVKRTLSNGRVRRGIVGAVDLEEYDYKLGSKSPIRATEGTVLSRIPPRLQIRLNAPLEISHAMLLIDDPEQLVIEQIDLNSCEKLYDFDLMENGGHIEGYLIKDNNEILDKLNSLTADSKDPLIFAVGDGNHSLATAKDCWTLKRSRLTPEERETDPARFALCEIVNLHDSGLIFEPIHRVMFNISFKTLLEEFIETFEVSKTAGEQKVEFLTSKGSFPLYIKNPPHHLTVGTMQGFLDKYIKKHGGKMDYIHGMDVVKFLIKTPGTVGVILPPIDKKTLFETVSKGGPLPRKTFSMGEAEDKRYYLEMKEI